MSANVLTVNGRPWDSFDGYLFDIDGTLLNCTDAVHYFAFCDALLGISGRPLTLKGVTTHGNTDIGILRDALLLANVEESDWRSKLPEIRGSMGRFVAEREAELCAVALPSVSRTLHHLQDRGAVLGIATGNLREIGRLKLKRAGLLEYFTVSGWSDDYEHRADVFRNALSLMQAATHPGATICVLGDTPADVAAAHANALPVIAVATGVYSQQQLAEASPDLCVSSFAEFLESQQDAQAGC
jgi:phosphoglycolate phosphatase-like HAD superfamily hydrolase